MKSSSCKASTFNANVYPSPLTEKKSWFLVVVSNAFSMIGLNFLQSMVQSLS